MNQTVGKFNRDSNMKINYKALLIIHQTLKTLW